MYARCKNVQAFLSLCGQEGYDFQAEQFRVLKSLQEGSTYYLRVAEEGKDTFYGVWSSQPHTSALLAAAIMAWPWNAPTCSCLNDDFSACGMSLSSYRSFKKWSRMAKLDHWAQVFEWRNPTPDSTPCVSPVIWHSPSPLLPHGLVSLSRDATMMDWDFGNLESK